MLHNVTLTARIAAFLDPSMIELRSASRWQSKGADGPNRSRLLKRRALADNGLMMAPRELRTILRQAVVDPQIEENSDRKTIAHNKLVFDNYNQP